VKAIVGGGGIGGLSVAIALRQVGVEAVVFERAGEIREIGARISLWSNATRALEKLGIVGAVWAAGVALTNGETRTWRGGVISRVSAYELQQRFGLILGIHRADLQGSLLAVLPGGTVRLGARCSGFEQNAEGVIARFDDGREERGDLLVGADGTFSTVRARLFGEERPRYAGLTAWRAVTRFEHELLPPGVALDLWGRGVEFGLLSLSRGVCTGSARRKPPRGRATHLSGARESCWSVFRTGMYR
jgi:2-polyprenyl-6-methoxyphenol hydroxylase-like FAD-dependent oxidoreductase